MHLDCFRCFVVVIFFPFYYTYAHAYLEALRFPVNNGESSARNLIRDFTFSASPKIQEGEETN